MSTLQKTQSIKLCKVGVLPQLDEVQSSKLQFNRFRIGSSAWQRTAVSITLLPLKPSSYISVSNLLH